MHLVASEGIFVIRVLLILLFLFQKRVKQPVIVPEICLLYCECNSLLFKTCLPNTRRPASKLQSSGKTAGVVRQTFSLLLLLSCGLGEVILCPNYVHKHDALIRWMEVSIWSDLLWEAEKLYTLQRKL